MIRFTFLDSPLRPLRFRFTGANKERWTYLDSNHAFNRGHLVFQHRRIAEVEKATLEKDFTVVDPDHHSCYAEALVGFHDFPDLSFDGRIE